ncbi:MAG: DUF4259 domain-containing protein [Myxococcota bacterium]
MGSWSEKAFDNDSALDWIAELEAGGIAALRATLSRAADATQGAYLDVDDGAAAIAAAEVVAAALEHDSEELPRSVAAWLDSNERLLNTEDQLLARRAVQRVLAAASELSELWNEHGAENPWRTQVLALLTRLGGDASEQAPPSSASESAAADSFVFDRQKQVLVTFLSARGLGINAQQRARIEACRDAAQMRRWLARAVSAPSIKAVLDD